MTSSCEVFVYLVQSRRKPSGMRTKRDHWQTEAAFLTLFEAEVYGLENAWRFFHGWRVERVEAGGTLARLIELSTRTRATG